MKLSKEYHRARVRSMDLTETAIRASLKMDLKMVSGFTLSITQRFIEEVSKIT